MKCVIKLLIFLCLLYPSAAFSIVCGEKVVLNISAADVCGGAANCPPSYTGSLPDNCQSTNNITVSSDGCVCVYEICCDDLAVNYEDGVHSSAQYTLTSGQNAGDEAQSLFNDYYPSAALPAPQEGFILTGSFEGFVYGIQYDMNGQAIMDFTSWKRGYYTKIGSAGGVITPIPGGGGTGGTGGGLSYEETATAVGEGVSSSFGTGDVSGEGSPTASYEIPPSSDSMDDIYDPYYSPGELPERDSITNKVTAFLGSNPLITAFSGTGVSVSGASCTLSGVVYGQTIEIDFCSTQSFLQIFGYFIVLVAGLYSFYVAWGLN